MKNINRFTLYMLFLVPTIYSNAQVSVLTQHNDLARTGQNTQETILTTANVNASTFGKIFTRSVDDQIFYKVLLRKGIRSEEDLYSKINIV